MQHNETLSINTIGILAANAFSVSAHSVNIVCHVSVDI